MLAIKEAGSILRIGFALAKYPHFHRAYLVTICKQKLVAVYIYVVNQSIISQNKRKPDFKRQQYL